MAIRYEPRVESIPGSDRVQQRFRADEIVIDRMERFTLVGFAESLAGAPLHGLLINMAAKPCGIPSADFSVEFNDQGNTSHGADTAALELSPLSLKVVLGPHADLIAGRVSYAPEADIADGPWEFPDLRLGAIFVEMSPTHEQLEGLRRALAQCQAFGCAFVDAAP